MVDKHLVCPECEGKLAWDGLQHVCLNCPWTEHTAKPPSERKITIPERFDPPKKPDDSKE